MKKSFVTFFLVYCLAVSFLTAQMVVNHSYNDGPKIFKINSGAETEFFNYYDSGGSSSVYGNSSGNSSIVTFIPADPSAKIQIEFTSFSTEANYDVLYVFDGLNTSAPKISSPNGPPKGVSPFGDGGWWGTTAPENIGTKIIRATNPSGALTLAFISDGIVASFGWSALVTNVCNTYGINNAGIASIDSVVRPCPGIQSVFATIQNSGTLPISNVTVNWEFDGVTQSPLLWSTYTLDTCNGSNPSFAIVYLGEKSIESGSTHTVKVWTTEPNGIPDTVNYNDTAFISILPGISGTFTLGGANPDFATFSDAISALNTYGVCGPVLFNIRTGTYNEQLRIGPISGVDSLKTVTFQSESGDSSQVILTFSAINFDGNYTLRLDSADWLVFRQITIEATNTNYGKAVDIIGGAEHVLWVNNWLKSASSSDYVVYATSNYSNAHHHFLNNRFEGGGYGLQYDGHYNNGNYVSRITLEDNIFKDQNYHGLMLTYLNNPAIRNNILTTLSNYPYFVGITLSNCTNGGDLTGNRITGITAGGRGIELYSVNGNAAEPFLVANNFVQVGGPSGNTRGIATHDGNYQNFFYNTVHLTGQNTTNPAFYNQSGSAKVLQNNIFVNRGGGYALFSHGGISASDYNDLYTTGNFLGYWNGDHTTLADWQTATGFDTHSLSVDPQFIAGNDYKIANGLLNNAGLPTPWVVIDIEGEPRAATPDLGADEFVPPGDDAALDTVFSPHRPIVAGVQSVVVVLRNNGNDALQNTTIGWEINGTAQPVVNWTGNLASSDTARVQLGTMTVSAGTVYTLRAWSFNPNGGADPTPLNDTASLYKLRAGLSGVYTIGGVSPDFITFNEAGIALHDGGVLGPVTFNIRDGIYNEQLRLGPITGVDSIHTVTFQSEFSDSSQAVLTFDATNYENNYTLLLDSADWLVFRRLTIEAINGSYGRVVEVTGGAEHVLWANNRLKSASSTDFIVYAHSAYPNAQHRFLNNRFEGGGYGLQFDGYYYNGNYAAGMILDGNVFENQNYQGFALSTMQAPVVRNNILTTTSMYPYYSGITLGSCLQGGTLTGNQISDILAGGRGIELYSVSGTVDKPFLVANNFVQIGGSSGNTRGINSYDGNYQHFFYNTIHLTGLNPTNQAFYNQWGSNKVLQNNIFANSGGGYAIYAVSGISGSNYNDLYTTGTFLGHWNGDRTTMAEWRTATGFDAQSISADPQFITENDYKIANSLLNNAGQPAPLVDTDIEGEPRSLTPDLGADEFVPPGDDAALDTVFSPHRPFAAGVQPVVVVLRNNGNDALQNTTIGWEINGTAQPAVNWTGNLASSDTARVQLGTMTVSAGTVYTLRAWSFNPNGGADPTPLNDTASLYKLRAGLSGVYTIGGVSPDFVTFNEAAIALRDGGVVGTVTFNVRNGIYNEQLRLGPITGVDSMQTVTFQSESGDSSQVSLTFDANSYESTYTLRLDSAEWLIFRQLTIEATNSYYGRVVEITGGSEHVLWANNGIKGSLNPNGYNELIYLQPGFANGHHYFLNNHFSGGYYGITFNGYNSNGNYTAGIFVEGNVFKDQRYGGINLATLSRPLVRNNTFTGITGYGYTGISLGSCQNGGEIASNKISDANDGAGIILASVNGSPASPFLVANNFVELGGSNDNVYGIALYDVQYIDVFYNTVHQTNTSQTSAAFFSNGGNNKVVQNNIFANTGGGYVFTAGNYYYYYSLGISAADYNNLYGTGPLLAYTPWNGNMPTLVDWQSATGFDAHSLSVDPLFISPGDPHISNILLDQQASPVTGVTKDIDGEVRDPIKPDIGADEFFTSADDASALSIDYPVTPFASGIRPVHVSIGNNGLDTLHSVSIQWEVNGVLQAPYAWSGNLLTGQLADSIQIGSFIFRTDTTYHIRAWTTLPNGQADNVNHNDTTEVADLQAALAGVYTIGGVDPDFDHFNEAATALNKGGVVGAVTFLVRNGIYDEQVTLNEIIGVNQDNPVVFQSENGDSTMVRLFYASADPAKNYTLRLNGTDWITFRKLTIEATNGTFGNAVDFTAGATHNTFENNEIKGPNEGDANYVLNSYDSNDDFITIRHNRILGGRVGVHLYGLNSSDRENGTLVEGNKFENQHEYAIYLVNQNAPGIETNTLISSKVGYSFRGVECHYCKGALKIVGNDLTGAATGYRGIYLYDCDGYSGASGLIANNFIRVSDYYSNGISLEYSDFQHIYHNSVNNTGPSNTDSKGISYYEGNNLKILNNIVSCPNGGLPVYWNSGIGPNLDYNDYHTTGPNLGYWNGAYAANLGAWQALAAQDAHSHSIDPTFLSNTNLHVQETDLNNAGTHLAEVDVDIDGEPRNPATPDIGADEFAPTAFNDAGVTEILHPNKTEPFPAGSNMVDVVIKNFSADTIHAATVLWKVNNALQMPYAWSGTLYPGERDTVSIDTYDFALGFPHDLTAWTENPNGLPDTSNYNDTAKVAGLYPGLSGPYTIGGVLPNFPDFSSAATSLNEGGLLGAVTFNVRNGTYDEHIEIRQMKGSSASNTVLFQSESGDSSAVTLMNGSNDSPIIYLNGANYVTLQKMTFQKATYDGSVFRLSNGAGNNSFVYNHMLGNGSGGFLIYGDFTAGNNMFISFNRFENAYYGVLLYGLGNSTPQFGTVIENNVFENITRAIYLNNQYAPVVKENQIGARDIGIYLNGCSNAFHVMKNKITTDDGYGIFLTDCNATNAARGLLANNFIHVSGSTNYQGIYLNGASFTNIFNNSVNVTNAHPASGAFYLNFGSNNNLLNNVFANTGGGYAIYLNGASGLANANYNDLFATGPNLGYWNGSNAANLVAYQVSSGKEANSISVDPLFLSNTDQHTAQAQLDGAGTPVSAVPDDIDGQARDAAHPDIGADEISFLADDIGVSALISPLNGCTLGVSESVQIRIQNYSSAPVSGFGVAYTLNGGTPVVEYPSLTLPPGNSMEYSFAAGANLALPGDYSLAVYTIHVPDSNFVNDTTLVTIHHAQLPASVTNMTPDNGVNGLPDIVTFSWLPAVGANVYDLYLWPAGDPAPTTPIASNLNQINYLYGSLIYGTTYNWQVVAKNDYCQTPGPVQSFTVQTLPELVISNITAPANAFSGQSLSVTWTVQNVGTNSTGMGQWSDAVYLSSDNVLDYGVDTYLGGVPNFSALPPGQGYSNTSAFLLPNGISGIYYLFVVTDAFHYLAEADNQNNSAVSTPVTVTLTPPPDLQVAGTITPGNAFSGTSITLNWTVKNAGSGETRSTGWSDQVFISPDVVLNLSNATYLGGHYYSGILKVDSSYTQTLNATLPPVISGTYYIYVITDVSNQEYEHANEGNNTGQSGSLQVFLTPPPDLQVTDVVAPASVSNKENGSISWTVSNPGSSPATGGWIDKIYLSTNPALTDFTGAALLGAFPRPAELAPGESYTANASATIPDAISGNYYLYVHTDAGEQVYEYTYDNNNALRSPAPTTVNSPDLGLVHLVAAGPALSGNPVSVDWTVKNNGPGKLIDGHWIERVYISPNATFSTATATKLDSLIGNATLMPGDSLNRSKQVILPNGISGPYYLYVFADTDGAVYENGFESNNVNAPGYSLPVTLAPWVDLTPTALSGPASANAGAAVPLSYTVKNMGAATAQVLNWKDKIYLLNSATWNPSAAVLLRTEPISQTLAVNASYSLSPTVTIPANVATGTYYFFVEADQENTVYEHTTEGNNRLASAGINITGYPPVDLAVTQAEAPASAASGQPVTVEWTTQNLAAVPTIAANWQDALYLSADLTLNTVSDILLGTRTQTGPLPAGASYAVSKTVTIPNGISGSFYLIVKTDHTGQNNDSNLANNVKVVSDAGGNPQVIVITLTPPSDLIVDNFSAPTQGFSGQPVELVWTVKNNGTGATTAGSWTDRFYLSTDFTPDPTDYLLGTVGRTSNLAPGQSYTDSVQFFTPISLSGNHILIVKTDNNDAVYEYGAENNNTATSAILLVQPPPSDLIVSQVVVPINAVAGEEVQISWTLKNHGLNPAVGAMKEAVFFSKDATWDAADPLLGTTDASINLAPMATQSRDLMANLAGVEVGNYYAIVRTDILNNILESDDNNNLTASALTVTVTVPELPLNVLTPDVLDNNKALYYRIEIPDSLAGETLLVTLKGDSTGGANELYLRFNQTPTRSDHDFAHGLAFSGNQEVLVPVLQGGTYYLLAYGSTTGGSVQDITLYAKILNFEIRSVHAPKGGNNGPVTLEIKGSKFEADMGLQLEKDGNAVFASDVQHVDPTKVFATFDLDGKTTGLYHVTAEKTGGETATLSNGFEIVAGGPPDLAINIQQPANARPNQIITIKIEYANNGTTDLLNPVATLKSLDNAPVALEVAGLSAGTTELDIDLEELNGPAGILRPGAGGVVTVYVKVTGVLGFTVVLPE